MLSNNYNKCSSCSVSTLSSINKVDLDSFTPSTLNWGHVSNTEILPLLDNKDGIKDIYLVSSNVSICKSRLIETPFGLKTYKVAVLDASGNPVYENNIVSESPCLSVFKIQSNAEGSCLSGRELIVSGTINQRIMYTLDSPSSPMHYVKLNYPFTTYIIVYPKFKNVPNILRDVVVIDPKDPTKTLTIKGYVFANGSEIEVDLCEEFCVNAYVDYTFVELLDSKNIYNSISVFISAIPTSNITKYNGI
ncbi:hypothetical protein [Paraclostridium sordellii]|uniref:hypothetical protein n=1 Tax=Paraclostridium sordellii TaxID=1505 RepID=UPI0005E1A185|nr:hypothetical protein [Paeniclostridium sordellii]CEN24576.1 Cna B-type domain-containing protein [[Clostridium] sordellii] [Paeniclostridium sordellii]